MRIASTGRAIFAVTMIGLGIIGVVRRDFVPLWNPAPNVSAGGLLVSLVSLISLAAGIGLLIRRRASAGARLLVVTVFSLVGVISVAKLSSFTRFCSLLVRVPAYRHAGRCLGPLCLVCH